MPVRAPLSRDAIPLPSFGRIARIKRVVAASYGVETADIVGKSRHPSHVWPRQVAMYLIRDIANRPLEDIGNTFGGRDHSTVFYALSAVEKRMAEDPVYRDDVTALREALA